MTSRYTWRPGRVKKCEQPPPGEELADIGEIAQRLGSTAAAAIEGAAKGGVEHAGAQLHVHRRAAAHHRLVAHSFQHGFQRKQPQHNEREHPQRGGVATNLSGFVVEDGQFVVVFEVRQNLCQVSLYAKLYIKAVKSQPGQVARTAAVFVYRRSRGRALYDCC